MKVHVLEIPTVILEVFTTIVRNNRQEEHIRDCMELILKSAAERILYAERRESSGRWRLLSTNSYQLLDRCLNNYLMSSSQGGVLFYPEDYEIDVELRGQHALFVFEKTNEWMGR